MRPHHPTYGTLDSALWPAPRAGEALFALAARARLPLAGVEQHPAPPDLDAEAMSSWIEAEADRGGFQADPQIMPLGDIEAFAASAPTALLRLRAWPGEPFLALVGRRGRTLTAVGPDRRLHRIRPEVIRAAICLEFEGPLTAEIDRSVDAIGLAPAKRARARAALLRERLASIRFRNCWILRPPASAGLYAQAREARLPRHLAVVVGAHLSQYTLFLISWWLLGRGALSGNVDKGWLIGWVLLLASLVPCRLLGTWTEGRALIAMGASLRRRLLHGALHMDPQEVRRQGVGRLFSVVVEGSALESLALGGGVQALFAMIELIIAMAVLAFAAGSPWGAVVLAGWTAAAGFLGSRYVLQRRRWTTQRLELTHRLLESIIGHRTRAIQQSPDRMHQGEDETLERYISAGHRMDHVSAGLVTVMPRGWLLAGVCILAVDVVPGAATSAGLAVTLSGILLAYRAFRRLSVGLTSLADAAIAWRTVAPLAAAAAQKNARPTGTLVSVSSAVAGAPTRTAVDVRDVTFRYREQGEPVVRSCNLRIERGANVLLEGPSGSGKTTLGSLIAGLRAPASGVVLIDGLDRSVVTAAAWRRRVLMTPQSHDNYLMSGSLAFNLLMGRRWPPSESDFADAEQVCRELGLGDLLDRMPSGLDQTVGETGWQLSQGERTRVFLARALLQRSDVLVLDETFSALDPESIDRVVRCVQRRTPTVLAIAHT
jgi:ATP-binding cassette subfamily B protein